MMIIYILGGLIAVIAIASLIAMLRNKNNNPSDYHLYGMDSDSYLKKQVGEDYYNKHYK